MLRAIESVGDDPPTIAATAAISIQAAKQRTTPATIRIDAPKQRILRATMVVVTLGGVSVLKRVGASRFRAGTTPSGSAAGTGVNDRCEGQTRMIE